jgi:hypothetical protein
MIDELEVANTANGATVIVVTAELVPQPLLPVTVYAAVEVGAKVCPFTTPGLAQVYDKAPEAVKVAVCPRQILVLGLAIDNTGRPPLTVTEMVLAVVQFDGERALNE